jgi:hypothetical protein
MKTKLKHIFLLAAVCLAAAACGSTMTKPVSGLDVSSLPAHLLSVGPGKINTEEAGQIIEENAQEQPSATPSTINN